MAMTRNTIQRSLVLDTVNKLNSHATADEVYEAIAREHPSISRGTVYRNLNQLAESGDIRKVTVPDGADRFEHRSPDHYHVRCLKCGRIFDVDMDCITDLETKIRDSHGFQFSGYDIVFKGICPDCAKKEKAHAGADITRKYKNHKEDYS